MSNAKLNISLAQYDIEWENKEANLDKIEAILEEVSGKSDLLVLPEMCTTGFTMQPQQVAEPTDGNTITRLKRLAQKHDIAICGSYVALEQNKYLNRAFFLTPQIDHFYDKKHLFRMGAENKIYSAGKDRQIFEHKGFNICLQVCYDIRFPVWARNVNKEYDLLIYVANWPQSRIQVWNTLLEARAIENMSYVCGVNRIGKDNMGLMHSGESRLINAKGQEILNLGLNHSCVKTVKLEKKELEEFRTKFPVWMDFDLFEMK